MVGDLFQRLLHLNEFLTTLNAIAFLLVVLRDILDVLSLLLTDGIALYNQTLALILFRMLCDLGRGHMLAPS